MIVFCVHGTFIDMEAGDKFLQYFFLSLLFFYGCSFLGYIWESIDYRDSMSVRAYWNLGLFLLIP